MVERSPEKAGVGGSIPSLATISFNELAISVVTALVSIWSAIGCFRAAQDGLKHFALCRKPVFAHAVCVQL